MVRTFQACREFRWVQSPRSRARSFDLPSVARINDCTQYKQYTTLTHIIPTSSPFLGHNGTNSLAPFHVSLASAFLQITKSHLSQWRLPIAPENQLFRSRITRLPLRNTPDSMSTRSTTTPRMKCCSSMATVNVPNNYPTNADTVLLTEKSIPARQNQVFLIDAKPRQKGAAKWMCARSETGFWHLASARCLVFLFSFAFLRGPFPRLSKLNNPDFMAITRELIMVAYSD